jgi:hypothetical protein
MIRPLMTPEEVKRRLAAGEDPLDLSITHWEINLERWSDRTIDILEDCNPPNFPIGTRTCALCVSTGVNCVECPYYIHYKARCYRHHHRDVRITIWDYEDGAASRQEVIKVTRIMLNALKEIANGRNS